MCLVLSSGLLQDTVQRAAAFNSHAGRRAMLASFLASDGKLVPGSPDSR